ncbi:CBO0543 family protein [Neobacillus dielmonensis]|uniref:CBO0543 family protein n=1 Tax=Neobacillus dielmonensis TaxID=1347369 RepID=UPI0005A8EBC9|nr:CBO0543 family protein [Neobacillus dielmonensis]
MHVAIAVLTIIASFKWGDWKNWREYHASMFFIATGGLLYEYIVKENTLWKFYPDLLYGLEMVVIVYALITMPISIFLFLSHFPNRWGQRFIYILVWSGIYIAVEWILLLFDRISYQNGWQFWYSFLFDLVMFSVIALHQYKPIPAYIISLFVIIFLIAYFDVPFKFIK